MRANRGRDTAPELAVRRAVHALGLRYRVSSRPVPGLRRTADLVFTKRRVAVFIDGCFWHGCTEHHTVAKTNARFWADKVAGNKKRDAETTWLLGEAGWTVLRFWEHEPPETVARAIAAAVRPQGL
jgi:DNA mismatch endonuclease (patch repair protein)